MNRRQVLKTLAGAAALSTLRPAGAIAQLGNRSPASQENTIYLHPKGVDTNPGTKDRPLQSLAAAARLANASSGTGAMTIILSEGVYGVAEQAVFKPERRMFTKTERLTIRAEILPDDPTWDAGRMPSLMHTMPLEPFWNGRKFNPASGGTSYGVEIETSHATIQGLRVLGTPVIETPRKGVLNRIYPIGRYGSTLDDLEIAQCVIAGDKVTSPNHLGIIANGTGMSVHHCVFYGCKLTAVYWSGGSTGHSMRNCLVYGAYGAGVWTSDIASDFDFRNNVIANSNYVWIYQSSASAQADPDAGGARGRGAAASQTPARRTYKVHDSLFSGNRAMAASGTGANLGFKDIDASFLELVGTTVSDQPVALDMEESSRRYLHPLPGSPAAKIGAGLFSKEV